MFPPMLRRLGPGLPILLLGLFAPVAADPPRVAFGPVPSWVGEVAEPAPPPPGPGGVRYLLVDEQIRADRATEQSFSRRVVRIETAEGVGEVSEIEVDFDPEYQGLVFHRVDVRRAGRSFDRLDPRGLSVFHREDQQDERIFTGSFTAQLVVDDLRAGDILEYSYTVEGRNPALGGHSSQVLHMGWSVPVDRLRYRVLWPADRPFHTRSLGQVPEPRLRARGRWREAEWTRDSLPALVEESGLPPWYDPYPRVQVGDQESWGEVVAWALPLYAPPTRPSRALRELVERIRAEQRDDESRLRAALRFVQDEIRYLGLEAGVGSHRPRDPSAVLERRLGDCKDKARLLATILGGLGIPAWPALVNTVARQEIGGWLPTAYAFDHVIAAVDLGGRRLWLDPTVTQQRGAIDRIAQADFGLALVVAPGVGALQAMRRPPTRLPDLDVSETIDLSGPGSATIAVRKVRRGRQADDLRAWLAAEDREGLLREDLNRYAADWRGLRSTAPIAVEDDTLSGEIAVVERFSAPRPEPARLRAVAAEIADLAVAPQEIRRRMPLSVPHPWWVRHRTILVLPRGAGGLPEAVRIRNAAFDFVLSSSRRGDTLVLERSYRSLSDHVDPAALDAYLADLDHLDRLSTTSLADMAPADPVARPNWPLLAIALLLPAFVLARRLPSPRPPLLERRATLPRAGLAILAITLLWGLWEIRPVFDASAWASWTDPFSIGFRPLGALALLFAVSWRAAFLALALRLAISPRAPLPLLLASTSSLCAAIELAWAEWLPIGLPAPWAAIAALLLLAFSRIGQDHSRSSAPSREYSAKIPA